MPSATLALTSARENTHGKILFLFSAAGKHKWLRFHCKRTQTLSG
jgi:hypothetical protein